MKRLRKERNADLRNPANWRYLGLKDAQTADDALLSTLLDAASRLIGATPGGAFTRCVACGGTLPPGVRAGV